MNPPVANARIRTYVSGQHGFFDDLVVFLGTLASNLVTAELLRMSRTQLTSDPKYFLQFEGCRIGVKLTWYPKETLLSIARNAWPSQVTLHENLMHPRAPAFSLTSSGARNLHSLSLQSSFLRYFESHRPLIEEHYGANVSNWPSVWTFARVVRNAFAHGGTVTIQNPTAAAVSWRGITHGPSQNDRPIIFQDMSFVEVLTLLEDLDACI